MLMEKIYLLLDSRGNDMLARHLLRKPYGVAFGCDYSSRDWSLCSEKVYLLLDLQGDEKFVRQSLCGPRGVAFRVE